jgi:mRNA interferase MazF
LTSKLFTHLAALRVEIPTRDRLLKPCYVMPEQLRALDRNRLGDGPLTTLTPAEMAQVEQLLLICCGMAGYLKTNH